MGNATPLVTARALRARLLICTGWADDGDWRFLNILREKGLNVELLEPFFVRSRLAPGWLKRLSVRLSPFYQPLLALLRGRRHDAVLTLDTRIGTVHGILARFFPRAGRPLHILRDFHLDFTRFADPIYQLRVLLVRLAVAGVDTYLATSREECGLYSAIFGIDPARIRFYPDTPGGAYMAFDSTLPEGDYVLAYGNSDRDFDTFLLAAGAFSARAVVLSQSYRPRVPLPPGARHITDRLPREELLELIARARAVVIPTKSYYVAAGQNAMLEVMALARPLVVTRNITSAEHAVHERDALFCPPGDAEAMAQAVERLLQDPQLGQTLGRNGRQAALACPAAQVEILLETLGTLLLERDRSQQPEPAFHG